MLKDVQGRLPPQDGRTDLLEIVDTAQVCTDDFMQTIHSFM